MIFCNFVEKFVETDAGLDIKKNYPKFSALAPHNIPNQIWQGRDRQYVQEGVEAAVEAVEEAVEEAGASNSK